MSDDFDFPPVAHPWREAFTAVLFFILIGIGLGACAFVVLDAMTVPDHGVMDQ